MIFRQIFDKNSSTYTYLLGDAGSAIFIDPVKEKTPLYLQLLRELNLTLIVALDTHVHADHITALGDLRNATGCITMMGKQARSECVSKYFSDGDLIAFGAYALQVLYTPGHTDDSYSFYVQAQHQHYVFTGDTLLIRGSGRTDFQNGDAATQYHSIFEVILNLPAETMLYPAHDYNGCTMSTLAEERAHNPRLQIKNQGEYIALMNNLRLPNPAMMDVAVPANQACGKFTR